MKIKKFTIENYKAIRGVREFEPNGESFFLIGGNGRGKTSAGHAMIDILTKNLPSKPITEGEQAGYIEFQFTNGAKLLARLLDGKKPQVEFITSDGFNAGSPKEIFQRLAGDGMMFDVDDILKLQPKPLREKLEKIAGLDLSQLNEDEKKAMEARALMAAKLRDQQGRVEPYDKDLITVEPESSLTIAQSINGLQNQLSEYNRIIREGETLTDRVDQLNKSVADARSEGHDVVLKMQIDLDEYIKKANEDIRITAERYTKKVEDLGADIAGTEILINEFSAWKADAIAPDENQIAALKEKLATVEETNKKIVKAKQLHQEWLIMQGYENDLKDLKFKVDTIRAKKQAEIEKSPLPAEGLAFNAEGEITIDGYPFEDNQISHARKIRAGVEIAASLLGDIKFLHIDGAALDKESADKILAFGESKGLQLCIERPEWEAGDLKFEIADHSDVTDDGYQTTDKSEGGVA
jgi:hypothetical protein